METGMEKLGQAIWARLGRTRTERLKDWKSGNWRREDLRIDKGRRKKRPKCDRNQSRILPHATLRMRGPRLVWDGTDTGYIT